MFSMQLRNTFRYHLPVLIFVLLAIAASRLIGLRSIQSETYSPYMTTEVSTRFDDLLRQSEGMTLEERAHFITEQQSAAFLSATDQNEINAVMRYQSELQHCFEVRGYRNYGLYGKGIVSMDIPQDIKNSRKYSGFAVPEVVNPDPFKKYLYLSSFSILPVIVMLLTAVLQADSYEKGVERQICLSAERAAFSRRRELIMILLITLICAAEQLSLLIISGAFFRAEYTTASLQSVTGFGSLSFRGTIVQVCVFTTVRQLLGALLCYELFALLAEKLCSVKKYILSALGAVALMSLAAFYIPELSPYMFAAVGKTENILRSLDYISLIDGSEAPVAIVLLSSLTGALAAVRRT